MCSARSNASTEKNQTHVSSVCGLRGTHTHTHTHTRTHGHTAADRGELQLKAVCQFLLFSAEQCWPSRGAIVRRPFHSSK